MKYLHIYALFLMVVLCTSCGQKQRNIPKDKIKSEIKDIGPDIMVRNIKKGRNGTILIAGPNNASFGDVFRYDPRRAVPRRAVPRRAVPRRAVPGRVGGKSFRNFKNPNPSRVFKGGNWVNDITPNNDITTITEDKTGKLWVGTKGAAFVYDPARRSESAKLRTGGKAFTTLTDKDGKTFNNVWSIVEDRKGNVWLGDVTHGLWRYDGSVFTKISERGAYAIIEDKKRKHLDYGSIKSCSCGGMGTFPL